MKELSQRCVCELCRAREAREGNVNVHMQWATIQKQRKHLRHHSLSDQLSMEERGQFQHPVPVIHQCDYFQQC